MSVPVDRAGFVVVGRQGGEYERYDWMVYGFVGAQAKERAEAYATRANAEVRARRDNVEALRDCEDPFSEDVMAAVAEVWKPQILDDPEDHDAADGETLEYEVKPLTMEVK